MVMSLLDWIESLLRDPGAREAFMDDPERYAEDHGFPNLTSADVHDALSLISDSDYPSPRHWDAGWDNDSDGARYLRGYLDDNDREIERHDTDIDNSVHQDIDTGGWGGRWDRDDWDWDGRHHRYHGGDFHQIIDNDPVVASGDGAVAAGGEIEDSTITTGSRNVVGDHNPVVSGDNSLQHADRTTSFGSGDATSANPRDPRVDDGGAISIDRDAHGYHEDNDTSAYVRNSGHGDVAVNTAGSRGYAEQHVDQSHDDDSSYTRYEDHSSRDSHDELDSHDDSRFDDSHDVDIHH